MQSIIKVSNLTVEFKNKRDLIHPITAVDNVSFEVFPGDSIGIIGESGCGKSTLARALIGLTAPTSGDVILDSKNAYSGKKFLLQKDCIAAMVFQDADSSLDPRMTVKSLIYEPFKIRGLKYDEAYEQIKYLFKLVNLGEDLMGRYPHEISGGQRQRLGMARALAMNSKVLIADEPAASLDSSIQAQILTTLDNNRKEKQQALIYISHNLKIVRVMTTSVIVMYLGQIVEYGKTEEIFSNPIHPYTKMLFSSVLKIGDNRYDKREIVGETPDFDHIPSGCKFSDRCSMCDKSCTLGAPDLTELIPGHYVRCHRVK